MPLKTVFLRPQNWSRLKTENPLTKALLLPSRVYDPGILLPDVHDQPIFWGNQSWTAVRVMVAPRMN